MPETPYTNIVENIKNWPPSRKLALAATVMLSAVLFALIIFQFGRADYMPLYTDLPGEEASSVTTWLREEGVSYELRNNGRSIYVPAELVYETRLNLAGAGLPKQSDAGFEIFDKQNFGVTQFTQQINYQRALQGELAKTIAAMDAVRSARVHLVMPEDRLLREQQEEAKASVVLNLASGRSLGPGEADGIVHLVAGSIEGLKSGRVTVVDTNGRVLSRENAAPPGMAMLPQALQYQGQVESRLETRAQSLLDRALGAGNAIVRVTADLDFTREAITSEEYDPDSLVPRSEQSSSSESGERQFGGVPGVEGNLGGGEGVFAGGVIPSIRNSEITNYEISKTIREVSNAVGTINNISAAVLVSETVAAGAGGAQEASITQEQLDAIQRMVVHAIGLEADRGDRIEVSAMPFRADMMDPAPMAPQTMIHDYLPYVRYAVLLAVALLLYFIVLRPVIRTVKGESFQYNKTVHELEYEQAQAPGKQALDSPARLRSELADTSVTPAQVVKTWLKEG